MSVEPVEMGVWMTVVFLSISEYKAVSPGNAVAQWYWRCLADRQRSNPHVIHHVFLHLQYTVGHLKLPIPRKRSVYIYTHK